MIFHSLDFLIFFIVVITVYWALRRRGPQNLFLLMASYVFYAYVHPWFSVLILTTTLVNFYCALGMEKSQERKKRFLVAAAVVSLGVLGAFKYFGFFLDNVNAVMGLVGLGGFDNVMRLALPVGISFYTFQALSYTIDVYKGELETRRNLPEFMLFVSFFPQLVAGPIERAGNLLPQVEKERRFDIRSAPDAAFLILWGFYKKLVIADNVAITANKIFGLENPSFPVLWAGVFAFTIQIYADFSAYTDIARGCAKLLGFDIVKNFDHPYMANSPTDFWRRWHISLSNWIRDYLYIPLGGARKGVFNPAGNLIVTFLLCGLWHGASWNFVFWGFYHGMLIFLHRLLRGYIPRAIRRGRVFMWVRVPVMFLLTMFGWLFFRETDFSYIFKYLSLSPFSASAFQYRAALYMFLITFFYSIPLWGHIVYSSLGAGRLKNAPRGFRLALKTAFAVIMAAGLLLLSSTVSSDFIYFQF